MKRLLARVLGALRSPVVKWAFLVIALGLAAWYVAGSRAELAQAAAQLSAWTVTVVVVLGFVYIWCTMLAWRAVLTDLGSHLALRDALSVFGLSQLGKYIPGGVWNVVAAAEIGADHAVPRHRSVASMGVALLVSVVSGAAVGAVALPFVSAGALGPWGRLVWAAPVIAVVLLPPVLNRLIGLALRLGRREPLAQPLTWGGLARATAWSVVGWLVAGTQIWALTTGLGMEPSGYTFALAVGGWALAWTVGFLAVVVPAGVGVREVVLAGVLAGSLPGAAAPLAVLVARVVFTVVDAVFAGVGLLLARRRTAAALARQAS
ncbi:lysylphosphatidylglycerol synthase domain-containing protein [Myceligenerans crystallogenes]|uniref:Lysylphosphatidylglycerol synthase transmembrane domain-containing protein n=1 Tax=Myceligenerans crystallogenes TaxID=316335 RepID=A0ABN2NBI0_9MICO